jgi:CheY-like chemotaxis protein
VAYGIARRHGGDVTVESEEGRGTTVRVTLPLPPGAAPPAPPPGAPAHQSLRILLVDDEVAVRSALADMLTTRGHTVVGARRGAQAVRRREEDPAIDVLLTDLVMPGMTGWELAATARTRRPRLRVGVVTGWGEVPDTTADAHTVADFVLSKPVTLDALDHAMGGFSRRERPARGYTPR